MAKPKRIGAVYYGQVVVPTDLQTAVGAKTKERSLRTKDPREAKRRQRAFEDEWEAVFDDIRSRRALTADDKAHAVWDHYTGTLNRDEEARRSMPTPEDIDSATRQMFERARRGDIMADDPLAIVDATVDVQRLQKARKLDAERRRAKLDALRKHLVDGETALIAHEVEAYADRHKLLIEPDGQDYDDLARQMMRAEIEALSRSLERDEGNYGGIPKDPIVKPATGTAREQAAPGETILELFEVYARENPNAVTADTLNQARRDIGIFVQHVGNTFPVHRLDKKSVREWKALLMRYPVKATESKAFAGMKIAQIVKENETVGKPVLTPRTVNRYLSSLGAFCDWLENHGYIGENPTAGMSLAKERTKGKPIFTSDQLNTLFRSPLFTGCQSDEAPRFWAKSGNVVIRDHRYWVPLIMLFSGARPAEIAQLAVSDVRQEHGHWIMHITTEGEGDKSVKTAGSMRVVPVHSELIELGFLDYHVAMKEAGEKRLFPEAKRNSRGQMIADFSREFPRYLSRVGIKTERGLSLYSFRHGATDALRRGGYLNEQFGFLLGHTKATTTGRYGMLQEGMLQQRVELVEAIAYPGLDLRHLEQPA